MSYLLRHKANKEGISIDKFGFILMDDLIGWLKSNLTNIQDTITPDTIRQIVDQDEKTRFTITTTVDGHLKIRANQGHSMEIQELDLNSGKTKFYKKEVFNLYYRALCNSTTWDIGLGYFSLSSLKLLAYPLSKFIINNND